LRRAEAERAAAAAREVEQRKRQKVKLALVATVAVLLAAIPAFAWWQNEQANRHALDAALLKQKEEFEARQARQGIESNLLLADKLRKQYKFKEAEDALVQAEKLAEGAPELAPRVKQARDDLAFAVRLDDIRFRKWVWIAEAGGKGYFNTEIAAPEYRKAFAERGRDLTALPPAEAAGWIAASAAKAELVAAVDDWATYEPDPVLQSRLLEIARRAAPGPWTDRLRDPAVRRDRAAVQKLAAEVDPARVPPAALSVLVTLMDGHKLDGRQVLASARMVHPSEFELAFALGQFSKGGPQSGPYEAARALRPENWIVWNNLGIALHDQKDLDGAIASYKKAIDLGLKNAVVAHVNLGIALRDKKDFDGATAALQKAIALDPVHPAAHNILGNALHDKKDFDGAIASYKKAIDLAPKYAEAHNNLGNALESKKDFDGAVAAFRKAIGVDPKYAMAHYNLGRVLHDKKQVDGAIAAFRKATELDPQNADAQLNLGLALEDIKDVDGAIAAYQKAIEANAHSSAAHSLLGLMYFQQKKYTECISSLRTAIKLNPKLGSDHAILGMSLFLTGDKDGGRAAMREAIRLDPKKWELPLSKYLAAPEPAPPPRLVKP
jgi:eukaryotic-like serine/threonine-protein kinase